MTDYAAAAVQPIVQGLVTITGNVSGKLPIFTGRGALIPVGTTGRPIVPPAPVGSDLAGCIILTLDVGLPGNAGAVAPVPNNALPPTALPAVPLPRTLITMRAPALGVPTTINSVSVAYGNFTVPTPSDGSLRQIAITLAAGAVLTDPVPTPTTPPFTGGANGFEIVVWAGVESP